jgi:hypothetical protein
MPASAVQPLWQRLRKRGEV